MTFGARSPKCASAAASKAALSWGEHSVVGPGEVEHVLDDGDGDLLLVVRDCRDNLLYQTDYILRRDLSGG
jgi:hypothetical protein